MKTEEDIKKAFPRIGENGMPMYIQGWHDALNWALSNEEESGIFIEILDGKGTERSDTHKNERR